MRRVGGTLTLLLLLAMGGCATHPPLLKGTPGGVVETLSSSVSISASGGEHGGSARGYLVFKRPDRLHLVFLSPFGASLFELFSSGDRITCIVPGKKLAFKGPAEELSDRDYLGSWRLMRWVLARPPVPGPSLGARELEMEDGRMERVFFYGNGLVQRKVTQDGEEVLYSDYREVDGVPFPGRIEITDRRGRHVKVAFDDPDINHPVDDEELVPKLQGYSVLPLRLLQESP